MQGQVYSSAGEGAVTDVAEDLEAGVWAALLAPNRFSTAAPASETCPEPRSVEVLQSGVQKKRSSSFWISSSPFPFQYSWFGTRIPAATS